MTLRRNILALQQHKLKKTSDIILPREYQLVEYLETTGTLWIDTLIKPTINAKVKVIFSPMATTGGGYFGVRNDPYRFVCVTFNSGQDFAFALTYNGWVSNREKIVLGKKYVVEASNGEYSINNNTYTTDKLSTVSFNDTFQVGIYKSNATTTYMSSLRLFYLRIDDVTSIELIPCYRKSDNKPGMYDIINNKFYTNCGTGEFEIGISADYFSTYYEQVEYIESNGNQCIDTGVAMKNVGVWESDIQFLEIKNSINGAYYSTDGVDVAGIFNNKFFMRIGGANKLTEPADLKRHVFRISTIDKNVSIDNINLQCEYRNTNFDLTVYHFVRNDSGIKNYTCVQRLYSSKIYDKNNTLIRNFIPCYRKYDRKPGLYDAVNGKFFTNLGTGEFSFITPLKYLEAQYGQYINTKYTPNREPLSLKTENFRWINNVQSVIFGCTNFVLTSSNGSWHRLFHSVGVKCNQDMTAKCEWEFDFINKTLMLNGSPSQTYIGDLDVSGELWLFGRSDSNYINGNGKIYYFKQGSNINLIPVLDSVNNQPCMFDTISGLKFYNLGTGTFGYETLDGIYVAPK